jgi:hypothetical protein
MGTNYGTSTAISPNSVGKAADMLWELSLPWRDGEKKKQVIDRTSKLCRLDYWRTWDIWYRKARRIEIHEMQQIAEALLIKNEKAARNEFHELKLRLATLEARFNAGDADFHSPAADYARDVLRQFGREDSAVAGRVSGHTHPKDPPRK